MMYLGGNGWYWRIVWHPKLDGVIEVRRAEGGVRSWEAEPGEYFYEMLGDAGTDRGSLIWGGTDLHACGTSTFNAFGSVHLQHEGTHISI